MISGARRAGRKPGDPEGRLRLAENLDHEAERIEPGPRRTFERERPNWLTRPGLPLDPQPPSGSLRNPAGITPMPADLNLHRNVREAFRQAMAEHRTQREAFHCAMDLVLQQEPHADPASTGRVVALMLATEP